MNPTVIAAVVGAVGALLGAVLGALATLSVNRANASKLLAEAQSAAQKIALESAQSTRTDLEGRCTRCETELQKVQSATRDLVDAIEGMLDEDTPATRLALRSAIWAARQAV